MNKPDQVANTWMRGFKLRNVVDFYTDLRSGIAVYPIRVRGLSVLCANAAYELQKCKGSRSRAKMSVGFSFDLWQKEMRGISEACKSSGF